MLTSRLETEEWLAIDRKIKMNAMVFDCTGTGP